MAKNDYEMDMHVDNNVLQIKDCCYEMKQDLDNIVNLILAAVNESEDLDSVDRTVSSTLQELRITEKRIKELDEQLRLMKDPRTKPTLSTEGESKSLLHRIKRLEKMLDEQGSRELDQRLKNMETEMARMKQQVAVSVNYETKASNLTGNNLVKKVDVDDLDQKVKALSLTMSQVDTKPCPAVLFSAQLGGTGGRKRGVIPNWREVVNMGGGLDPLSGRFRAPRQGIYSMTCQLVRESGAEKEVKVGMFVQCRMGRQEFLGVELVTDWMQRRVDTGVWTGELKEGDTVFLSVIVFQAQKEVNFAENTRFSGWLLH